MAQPVERHRRRAGHEHGARPDGRDHRPGFAARSVADYRVIDLEFAIRQEPDEKGALPPLFRSAQRLRSYTLGPTYNVGEPE